MSRLRSVPKSDYASFCGCLTSRAELFACAVQDGDAAAVSELLRIDITLMGRRNPHQQKTAWHFAAKKGHLDVLQALQLAVMSCTKQQKHLLLSDLMLAKLPAWSTEQVQEHPANIYVHLFLADKCVGGFTPLMLTAKYGHVLATSYLLSLGKCTTLCTLFLTLEQTQSKLWHQPQFRLRHTGTSCCGSAVLEAASLSWSEALLSLHNAGGLQIIAPLPHPIPHLIPRTLHPAPCDLHSKP